MQLKRRVVYRTRTPDCRTQSMRVLPWAKVLEANTEVENQTPGYAPCVLCIEIDVPEVQVRPRQEVLLPYLLHDAFHEVSEVVARGVLRRRIKCRRPVGILSQIAMETAIVARLRRRRRCVVVKDRALREAVCNGLIVGHTLTEDARLNSVGSPYLAEVVTDAWLKLLERRRTERVIGRKVERKAVDSIVLQLWNVYRIIGIRPVVGITSSCFQHSIVVLDVERLKEVSQSRIKLIGQSWGE